MTRTEYRVIVDHDPDPRNGYPDGFREVVPVLSFDEHEWTEKDRESYARKRLDDARSTMWRRGIKGEAYLEKRVIPDFAPMRDTIMGPRMTARYASRDEQRQDEERLKAAGWHIDLDGLWRKSGGYDGTAPMVLSDAVKAAGLCTYRALESEE